MTIKDLELLYKRETGKYAPYSSMGNAFPTEVKEYVKWLEEIILQDGKRIYPCLFNSREQLASQ